MKNIHNIILYIALGVLIIFLFRGECNRKNQSGQADTIRVVKEYFMDTTKVFTTYIPKPVIINVPESIPFIDSAYCRQLATEYFTEKIYNDTLSDDTTDIFWSARINKNGLTDFSVGYFIKKPFTTITETTIIPPLPKIRVHAGLNAGYGQAFWAGPELSLSTRNDYQYRIGAFGSTKADWFLYGGMSFKISFKKK